MNSPRFPVREFPNSHIFSGSGDAGQEPESPAQARFNARVIDKSAIDNFLAGMDYLSLSNLVERTCTEAQNARPREWINKELEALFERHGIEYEPCGHDDLKSPKSQAVMNLLLNLQTDSGQKKSDVGKPLHERFCALLQDAQSIFTGGQQLLITEIGRHATDSAFPQGAGSIPLVEGASRKPSAPPACGTVETEDTAARPVKTDINERTGQVERTKAAVDALSGLLGELSAASGNPAPVDSSLVTACTGVKLTGLAHSLNMGRVDFFKSEYVSTSLGIAVTVKPGYPIVPVLLGAKSAFDRLPDYMQRRLTKACSCIPDEMVSFVHAFMVADDPAAFEGARFKIFLNSKINPEYGSLFKEPENHHYCPVVMDVSLPNDLISNNPFCKSRWSVHEQGVDDDVVTLTHGRSADTGCRQDIEFSQLQPINRAAGGGDALAAPWEVGLVIPFGVQICRQSDRVLRRLRQEPTESRDDVAGCLSGLDQFIARVFNRGAQVNITGSVGRGNVAPASGTSLRFPRLAKTVLTNSAGVVAVRTVSDIDVSNVDELKSRLWHKVYCTGS